MLIKYFSKQTKLWFLHPDSIFSCYASIQKYAYIAITIALIALSHHSLHATPIDSTQGEVYRIIYLHVPLAVLSLLLYLSVGLNSGLYLVFHTKMNDLIAQSSAITGLIATGLVLITGSIWAKPTWGTWWFWDGRLTSELMLFLIYIGHISLRNAIKPEVVAKAYAAQLGCLGLINLPIIHYSVEWWYTLHQGPTLLAFQKPKMAIEMLMPLLFNMALLGLLFLLLTLNTMYVIWKKQSQWRKAT